MKPDFNFKDLMAMEAVQNKAITNLETKFAVIESKVDDIMQNHLKDLKKSQERIMWLLISTLITALTSLGIVLLNK